MPVGLDRLSVSFPLDGLDEAAEWQHFDQRRDGSWTRGASVVVGGADVFVGAALVNGGRWGKVEFNPSRVGDPDGVSLATVREAVESVSRVAQEASAFVSTPVDLASWRVKRADVARDFDGVEHADYLVPGLMRTPRPHARRVQLFNDPKRNRAATLWAGSGAGGARLYHKGGESPGKAEPDAWRFEVEARADHLERFAGVVTLGDLTEERARRLFLTRADWFQVEAVVAGSGVLRDVASLGLSARRERQFLGWLVQESFGSMVAAPGRSQQAEYRRFVRQLGVSVGPQLFALAPWSVHLDLVEGTEVVRRAA